MKTDQIIWLRGFQIHKNLNPLKIFQVEDVTPVFITILEGIFEWKWFLRKPLVLQRTIVSTKKGFFKSSPCGTLPRVLHCFSSHHLLLLWGSSKWWKHTHVFLSHMFLSRVFVTKSLWQKQTESKQPLDDRHDTPPPPVSMLPSTCDTPWKQHRCDFVEIPCGMFWHRCPVWGWDRGVKSRNHKNLQGAEDMCDKWLKMTRPCKNNDIIRAHGMTSPTDLLSPLQCD